MSMNLRTIRDEVRRFWNRLTGQEDARKIQSLEWNVKRLEEDVAKKAKRITDEYKRNEDLRDRLNEISTQNIQLVQDNKQIHEKLEHAVSAVRLYQAAAKVMQDAQSEAYQIR